MTTPPAEKIILFSRFPRPGQAKTRLIPALGAEGAAGLQRLMTARTAAVLRRLAVGRRLELEVRQADGSAEEMRSWLGPAFTYSPQGEGDLGKRMNRALGQALGQGFGRVVLVGSDCPELSQEILARALDALEEKDLVLGPARDGGYYLVGLSRLAPELFRDIAWGTGSVLRATLERAGRAGLSHYLLPALDDVDLPEDLPVWNRAGRPVWAPGRISVIIPTLNETGNLPGAVRSLAGGHDFEVLVADGGSGDGTPELALELGLDLLRSRPSRGGQFRAAAPLATGEYLVFLHADARLQPGWDREVRRILNRAGVSAGAFEFRLDKRSAGIRLIELMVHLRSRLAQLPYGDQAIFIRAELLDQLGGFPGLDLMEDVALIKRARTRGRIAISPLWAVSSARRWERLGLLKNTLGNWRTMLDYQRGGDPAKLAKRYYPNGERLDL